MASLPATIWHAPYRAVAAVATTKQTALQAALVRLKVRNKAASNADLLPKELRSELKVCPVGSDGVATAVLKILLGVGVRVVRGRSFRATCESTP